jgi:hypothetical protein
MTVVLSIVITAMAALLTFVLLKRRDTPDFEIPNPGNHDIGELLPVIAGLTRSVLFRDNEVSVLQDAAVFDAMFADIDAAQRKHSF